MASRRQLDGLTGPFVPSYLSNEVHQANVLSMNPSPYGLSTILISQCPQEHGVGSRVVVKGPIHQGDPHEMYTYGSQQHMNLHMGLMPPGHPKGEKNAGLRQANIVKMFGAFHNHQGDVIPKKKASRKKGRETHRDVDRFIPCFPDIVPYPMAKYTPHRKRSTDSKDNISQATSRQGSHEQPRGKTSSTDQSHWRGRGLGPPSAVSKKHSKHTMKNRQLMESVLHYPKMQAPLNLVNDVDGDMPLLIHSPCRPLHVPSQPIQEPVTQPTAQAATTTSSSLPISSFPNHVRHISMVNGQIGMKEIPSHIPMKLVMEHPMPPAQHMPGMPPVNNAIIMEPIAQPAVPITESAESIYIPDTMFQQMTGNSVALSPSMKLCGPSIPCQMQEEDERVGTFVMEPIMEHSAHITVQQPQAFPVISSVGQNHAPVILDNEAQLPPPLVSSQVPLGVSLNHVIPAISPLEGPIAIQPPPIQAPVNQDFSLGIASEINVPGLIQPQSVQIQASQPIGLPIAEPSAVPPDLENSPFMSEVTLTQHDASPLNGATDSLEESTSLIEEIMKDKDAISDVQRDRISAGRKLMESLQTILENKRVRMRKCLEEDCKNVIGLYSMIDAAYPEIWESGEKRINTKDIAASLLPYHMFYYPEFRSEGQQNESQHRKRSNTLSKLEQDLQELKSTTIDMKLDSHISLKNIQALKTCLRFRKQEIRIIEKVTEEYDRTPPEAIKSPPNEFSSDKRRRMIRYVYYNPTLVHRLSM